MIMRIHPGVFIQLWIVILCFLFSAAMLYGNPSNREEVKIHNDLFDSINLTPSMDYAELQGNDISTPVSIEKIHWKNVDKEALNFGYSDKTYWFRCAIRNTTSHSIKLYLIFEWPLLDRVEFFSVDRSTALLNRIAQSGDTIKHNDWPLKTLDPAFSLQIPAGERSEFYFRLKSTSLNSFPVRLYSENGFLGRERARDIFIWSIVAAALVIAVYNVVFFFQLREIVYLYLSLMVISLVMTILSLYGYGFGLFWPGAIHWQAIAMPVLSSVFMLTSLFFSRELLDLSSRPVINRIFQILIVIVIAKILTSLFGGISQSVSTRITGFLFFILLVLFLISGAIEFRRMDAVGKYYSAGWGLFLLTTTAHMLYGLQILPHSILTRYIFATSVPFVFSIFTLGSRERILVLFRQLSDLEAKLSSSPILDHPKETSESYQKSYIGNLDVDEIVEKIQRAMEDDHLYCDEDLKVSHLADRIGITSHQLSEILATKLKTTFPVLLRDYRVRMACKLLFERQEMSIIRIGYECGFGSKSSFNRSFKDATSLTPGEYRQLKLSVSRLGSRI